MKLKQTLSVIHFENREKAFQQEQQSTEQTNSFHYSIMTTFFNDIKFTQDICTQCGPIFFKQSRVKNLLKILQSLSK